MFSRCLQVEDSVRMHVVAPGMTSPRPSTRASEVSFVQLSGMDFVCTILVLMLVQWLTSAGAITNDPKLRMAWTPRKYYELVTERRVRLRGWPSACPFGDLSYIPQSATVVPDLQRRWDSREMAWESVPKGEILTAKSVLPPRTLLEAQMVNPGRSDIGGTHRRPVRKAKHPRASAKSPPFIDASMDSEIEAYSDDNADLRWIEHRDRFRHTDPIESDSP